MQPIWTPKQAQFIREGNHRWNFKGGATRSGKTYMDFRIVIPTRIRERAGKEGLTVILGVTKATIERNVLEPMRTLYGDELVAYISSDNTVMLFGEKCYALGAEKLSQVSKLRGSSIKYCYGDEVADWSPDVFGLLKSRLDKDYSCFDGTYNPQGPTHWLKEFLDSDADIFSQVYTIDDNPFLPPAFVENLKREYQGTVLYDRYILGMWAAAEGALFTTYPEFTDDEELLYNGIAHVDASYGGSDYTAFTCGKRDGDKLYLYGKLWNRHVDTVVDFIAQKTHELRCSPIYMETNADKGYLGREFQRNGEQTRMYNEYQNKFFKIATFLRKWWPNIVFLEGTDKAYISQILSYTEAAEHDDAPDSAACVCRILDRRE
jgi:PBSX family phage terminase large subunit